MPSMEGGSSPVETEGTGKGRWSERELLPVLLPPPTHRGVSPCVSGTIPVPNAEAQTRLREQNTDKLSQVTKRCKWKIIFSRQASYWDSGNQTAHLWRATGGTHVWCGATSLHATECENSDGRSETPRLSTRVARTPGATRAFVQWRGSDFHLVRYCLRGRCHGRTGMGPSRTNPNIFRPRLWKGPPCRDPLRLPDSP